MKMIIVISQNPADARVLEDLLRIYFPGIIVKHQYGKLCNDNLSCPDEIMAWLEIAEMNRKSVKVVLEYKGEKYEHLENLPGGLEFEDEYNQKRRLLRLAVHKVIQQISTQEDMIGQVSPWGILTGVRPTKIVHRLVEQGLSENRIISHFHKDYGLTLEKAKLLTRVALIQRPYLLTSQQAKKIISIYIGIPFCPTRCHYCSFPAFSLKKWGHLLTPYLTALNRELRAVAEFLRTAGIIVQTVYLGGGTPTILTADQLEELLSVLEENFTFTENKEITIEGGRPDTLSYDKIKVMYKHKVNRLSINPQTMHEETLAAIGRKHSVEDVKEMYSLARKVGIPYINMDLIIGLPGENKQIVAHTLGEILELRPENITLHALAIKRTSRYGQEHVELPAVKEGQAMMELAHSTLQAGGYTPYYLYRQKQISAHGENVGYCLGDSYCLYNIQMIEEHQTILGFGVGAGSKFVKNEDWTLENIYNPKDVQLYLERIENIITRKVDKLKAII